LKVEELEEQKVSQQKVFDEEILSNRQEFQRMLDTLETQISALQVAVETGATSQKSSEVIIDTLKANLTNEKQKSRSAFAQVAQLNVRQQEQIAKIVEFANTMNEKSAMNKELENRDTRKMEKEDLICMLKEKEVASNDKDVNTDSSFNKKSKGNDIHGMGDKISLLDKDSKTQISKGKHAEIAATAIFNGKHSLTTAMSIDEPELDDTQLNRAMSVSNTKPNDN